MGKTLMQQQRTTSYRPKTAATARVLL